MARKKKSTVDINDIVQLSLLDIKPDTDADAKKVRLKQFTSFLYEMLNQPKKSWRGLVMTPPASFIERVVSIFDRDSDFPLEVPFFIFWHVLSGELLNKRITLKYGDRVRYPQIWSVILADSGAGKSTTLGLFRDVFHLASVYDYTGISSREKFIEELEENNHKLFIADEFWQQVSLMREGKKLEDMKPDMLKIYSHDSVKAKSRHGANVEVTKPVISHLGITVGKDITNCISASDLLRGYCQRMRWIFARRTKPIRPEDDIRLNELQAEWEEIWGKVKYEQYIAHTDAKEAVQSTFNFFRGSYKELDESYFKRIMEDAHSYALLYHIMLGKGDKQTVDLEDYGWAARVLGIFYSDIKEFLHEATDGDLERKLRRCEEVYARVKASGRQPKPRDLIRGVNSIKTANEARMFLDMIEAGSLESATPKDDYITI